MGNANATIVERLQAQGIRRLGSPTHGFRDRHTDGRPVSVAEQRRLQELKPPPAWKEVAVSESPRSRVQAVGKDGAGRWQYLYQEGYVQRRQEEKYRRLLAFGAALPKLRQALQADLRRPQLDRQKVLACMLRLLSAGILRAGSQVYADEHGSYGLATLQRRHVRVKGDTVVLDFPGKFHKRQHRELVDRRVARVVRLLLKLPGRRVFKFRNPDGTWTDVRRRHVNEYIMLSPNAWT